MIPKPFNDIKKEHIDALIQNRVRESKTIDYKEEIPGNRDEDKREFLYDITSFANAGGGDLIYGVTGERDSDGQPTGLPSEATGIARLNADSLILRLQGIIQTGVDPRIPNVQMKPIDGFREGPIFLVRVPQSWASPHMVIHSGISRFYSRSSAGKYRLDVREIRSAFALSEEMPKRLRRFRMERLAKIVADETPTLLQGGAKVVLHVVPLTSLDPSKFVDFRSFPGLSGKLPQMRYYSGWDSRFNFDGFMTFNNQLSYVQIFKNGIIEAVDAFSLNAGGEDKRIAGVYLEKMIRGALRTYTTLQRELMVDPPFFVLLSLLGVRGYRVITESTFDFGPHDPIDRDDLIFPEVVMQEVEQSAEVVLKPTFDSLWQACGFSHSPSYDDAGNWIRGE